MSIARLMTTTVKKHIPLSMLFELTYQCNLQCCHCYVVKNNKKELTTKEIKNILDQLKKEGCLILTFSGGEIFLRDDLFEIIHYAKQKKFLIKLYTNATLISSKEITLLKKTSPYEIHISVYGVEAKTHDEITKVPGSFDKTFTTLKKLKKEGFRIKLKCPLLKQNVGEYEKIISLAKNLKVEYLLDPIITPRQDKNKNVLMFQIEKKDLKKVIIDPALKSRKKKVLLDKDEIIANQVFSNLLCNAGYNSCTISPYGDVFPCIQYRIKLGNIRKDSFHSIWHLKESIKKIRAIKQTDLKECTNCQISSFCSRCPGLALLEGRDLFGKSLIACRLAKVRQELNLKNT